MRSTERDARIVRSARLLRLLADRHEYMSAGDIGERIDRTSPFRALDLTALDAEAIEDATEIDRLCGAAVRLLRKCPPSRAPR